MSIATNLSEVPDFRTPFWCFNGHIHTIACSLFGNSEFPSHTRTEIGTPDGDFLELDVVDQQNENPVIALFHGLEGSSSRYYMADLAQQLSANEVSVVAVNFRGCGSRLNRQPRFYHSGETGDYATVFNWIREYFPNQYIGAVGFSLGGNAFLKSLGEERAYHPVDAAVAVSVPYDLRMGSLNISKGFNRIYEYRFLRSLKKKLAGKRRKYPALPGYDGSTLYTFDDQITSKLHGFADAEDYYTRCSSKNFLTGIRKPTLLIHSRQDPICPVAGIPLNLIKQNTFLDYIITGEGGHVGFSSNPKGWLNRVILNYFISKIG